MTSRPPATRPWVARVPRRGPSTSPTADLTVRVDPAPLTSSGGGVGVSAAGCLRCNRGSAGSRAVPAGKAPGPRSGRLSGRSPPPGNCRREEPLSVTTSDLPAEGQPDVSTEGTEAPFDDVITLSTSTGEDGVVTVTVVGEVDTFTAPVLRSTLDGQLEQQPRELVIDLSGVQFLGSAGLAVLVETQKSSRAREVSLRLIATTRAVTRPLEVTGLIDLFTIADSSAR